MIYVYIIPVLVILIWQFILLYAYGKDIDWQKRIDNKLISISKKINTTFKSTFFKKNSEIFYVFSINSIVASSLLLLKYIDSDPVLYYILFLISIAIWIISLSLKINIETESIEKYIDEFLMTINVSLIFSLLDKFQWTTITLFLLISLAIIIKYRIDKKL